MLYYLFEYLDKILDVPGTGVFQYITFRSALALMLSLLLSTIYGKRIIRFLQRQQVGETVRELGLAGQNEKAGTPTMGGLIIIFATLVPVVLFAKLHNIYIVLLIVTTLWMGTIGFIDDYIKIFKKDKAGLKGIFKVFGQVGLGLIVGVVLYFHAGVTVRKDTSTSDVFKAPTLQWLSLRQLRKNLQLLQSLSLKIMNLIMLNYWHGQVKDMKNGLGWFLFQWSFLSLQRFLTVPI